jgi:putative FmdB family regulatory protein
MPFYEYECQSCKFYTELMQKISDPPLEKCPSCGKKTMRKLISAPVFRLKGAGWYETDFKGDKENKRNLAGADKEESKAESDSGAKAPEAKTDAKPAGAAETKAAPAPAEPKRERAASGGRSSARSVIAAKGKSKPAAKASSSRPSSKPKAKAKGKAKKGRR